MLLENFDAVHDSPSYLYYSALPFSPSSSWLHECYTAELLQVAKVVEGLPAEWGKCSRTVLLNNSPWTISYWNNTIAVGSSHKDILILDAITGSQTAVLPGHTDEVRSLTFTSDGISLVSGSYDKTVKLWDVQTGGVVKTFYGHTDRVCSVSISADYTIIASGSLDQTVHLWDTQTGECHQIIEQQNKVHCVSFSPKDPQTLISVSGTTVQQWDIDGHKVGPMYKGFQIVFSPDGTQFVSHVQGSVVVQGVNSGVVIAKFDMASSYFFPCCLSPDGRLLAVAADYNVCVLDITNPEPCLIETFFGHTNNITSLAFSSPSTLISVSQDKSVKFWQIGTPSMDPVLVYPESTPLTSAPTKSIAQKAKIGPIIPSDLPDGAMKTWGILTGHLCKESQEIPAEYPHQSNIQLVNSKLIFVWYANRKISIWDAEKGRLLQTIDAPEGYIKDLRVSGDGSKFFYLYWDTIKVWDIWTRKVMDEVKIYNTKGILVIDGSKVWVDSFTSTQGWDFGIPGSFSTQLSNKPPDRLHLNDAKLWETDMSRMKDTITGKVVFQLPERFGKAVHVQWSGQYLVVSLRSKEVLILDFSHMLL